MKAWTLTGGEHTGLEGDSGTVLFPSWEQKLRVDLGRAIDRPA